MPKESKVQSFLDLISSLLPAIFAMFSRIIPDWSDVESARKFALLVLGWLADLAGRTKTTIDDQLVWVATKIANDPTRFSEWYSILLSIIDDDEPIEGNPRVEKMADEVGVAPAVIVELIFMVLELVKMWRNRKEDPAVECDDCDDCDCDDDADETECEK